MVIFCSFQLSKTRTSTEERHISDFGIGESAGSANRYDIASACFAAALCADIDTPCIVREDVTVPAPAE